MMFYLLSGLEDKKWWQRLVDLERAIERGQIQEAHGAYRDVFRCLVERGCCDLTQIAAEDLLGCNSDGGRDLGSGALLTDSLNCALSLDIECLISATLANKIRPVAWPPGNGKVLHEVDIKQFD